VRTGAPCAGCHRSLAPGVGFVLRGQRRCLWCALVYRPMLRRSLCTGLVVGTVLTAINHGVALADGRFAASMLWQIPLTYAVPFCVATWGGLSNSRA
jgi:hypothetical protein